MQKNLPGGIIMLSFGMPTLIETKTVQEMAALCGELGLSFMELNTNFPLHQPHLLDACELNALAEKYGIFYTIHLNDEMPVAEFSPSVAGGYRQAVLQTIELAKKIGAKKLNMHLAEGAHYTMPDKIVYFYDAYLADYLKGMAEFRDMCQAAIGDSGIMICIENVSGFRDFQLAALDILLESPVFGLTLDIGHNYCTGGVDEPWIMERADRLHHMHMHDAKDGKKDHQALGLGEIDIPHFAVLAEKHNCTVVLETKTVGGLRQSVEWIKNSAWWSK